MISTKLSSRICGLGNHRARETLQGYVQGKFVGSVGLEAARFAEGPFGIAVSAAAGTSRERDAWRRQRLRKRLARVGEGRSQNCWKSSSGRSAHTVRKFSLSRSASLGCCA